MRYLLRVFVICFIICFLAAYVKAQNGSNMGTEFYTTYADHIYPAGTPGGAEVSNKSYMVLYITSNQAANVTVAIADGSFNSTVSITANKTVQVQIPPSAFLGNTSGIKAKQAIHITATQNVAVFAELYGATTVGVTAATMLLPVNTLGKDYQSINYSQTVNSFASTEGNSYSFFNVVAIADNTQVLITPSAPIFTGDPTTTSATTTTPFTITLNKGDVYQALSSTDLTGTKIQSVSTTGAACNPVAVFSGSTKIYIGGNISNCSTFKTSDNLFQQVYPNNTWGTQFITVPLAGRESATGIFRIIVQDPATQISGISYNQSDLAKGYLEFTTDHPLYISTSKPVQVVQYALTQFVYSCKFTPTGGDVGDPEMILLNPIEQGVTQASFYSTGRYAISESFLNVTIPTSAVSSVKVDNITVPITLFHSVAAYPGYSYAQLPLPMGSTSTSGNLNNGSHQITASANFNATAYGFGNYESYGYSAGAAFTKLNESVSLNNNSANTSVQTTACSGIGYTPQLTLPFTVNQITWKFSDGTTYVQKNPAVSNVKSYNQTIYNYSYFNTDKNTDLVYLPAGPNKIIASVTSPQSACGTDDNEFDINVLDAPVPIFTAPDVCVGQQTTFTLTTPTDMSNIASVNWDFGDGTLSGNLTSATATHTYATAGNYNVVATIAYKNGCSSVSAIQVMHVLSIPVASFIYSALDCAGTAVAFTDKSDAKGSTITWLWDFGDGSTSTLQNPTHTYNTPSIYPVTLTITNSTGCQGAITQQNITVNPSPVITLAFPGNVCENAGSIQITENKNGNIGTGIFTGYGISASGVFDPAFAGLGTHTINYLFTATQTGCTYTQAFNIVVKPVPVVTTGPDLKINEGGLVMLTATAAGDSLTYKWSPSVGLDHDNILNPMASPFDDTKYTLTVTSPSGCTNTADISVVVVKMPKPSNTFTPNNDGINDYWYIDQLEKYPDATVNVYARHGEKVFSSVGYSVPWDGKYNGSDLPVGVYYYIVTLNGGKKVMSGYVTIVR